MDDQRADRDGGSSVTIEKQKPVRLATIYVILVAGAAMVVLGFADWDFIQVAFGVVLLVVGRYFFVRRNQQK